MLSVWRTDAICVRRLAVRWGGREPVSLSVGVGFLCVRRDDSLPERAARKGVILSHSLPGCRKCGTGQCRDCP